MSLQLLFDLHALRLLKIKTNCNLQDMTLRCITAAAIIIPQNEEAIYPLTFIL